MHFSLGKLLATPAALRHLEQHGTHAMHMFDRHLHGDWGDLCAEDKQANQVAIEQGLRILSAFKIAGAKLYVITEADRSCTTVLLASEY